MKRRATVDPAAVLTATLADPDLDDTDVRVLEAAEWWLRTTGLRRWSIEDVATRAGVGHTAITQQMAAYVDDASPELAEAAARFGLSFILTRSTVLPLHDERELAGAVRRMIRPFLQALDAGT